MNWKMTRPDHTVRFEKDEPFCTFFPVKRGLVAACEPRMVAAAEDPELVTAVEWGTARRALSFVGDNPNDIYQRWYANGEHPRPSAGRAPDDHETNIVAKKFSR
jgi:hypothetical protein